MPYRFRHPGPPDRQPAGGAGHDQADENLFAPPTDVTASAEAFEIRLELPGVDPQRVDITVAVDSRTVEVSGVKSPPALDSGARYLNIEVQYGPFARVIALPEPVDGDQTTAEYTDGFLVVRLPRIARHRSGRSVPIEGAQR